MYYILISNENHVKWCCQMSNIHYTPINNGQSYIMHNQLYIGTVSINKTKVNKCPYFVRYCVRGLIKSTNQWVDLVCLIWSLIWISRLWKIMLHIVVFRIVISITFSWYYVQRNTRLVPFAACQAKVYVFEGPCRTSFIRLSLGFFWSGLLFCMLPMMLNLYS